jgi:LAGLIDADG endonuclease
VGSINKDRDFIVYKVGSLKDLTKTIIPHFEKYILLTQKRADFELFKQIVYIKANNRILSLDNFQEILSLRVNLNKGTSEKLKHAFPNIIQTPRPVFSLKKFMILND